MNLVIYYNKLMHLRQTTAFCAPSHTPGYKVNLKLITSILTNYLMGYLNESNFPLNLILNPLLLLKKTLYHRRPYRNRKTHLPRRRCRLRRLRLRRTRRLLLRLLRLRRLCLLRCLRRRLLYFIRIYLPNLFLNLRLLLLTLSFRHRLPTLLSTDVDVINIRPFGRPLLM